jgi:hypothetical protein
MAERLLTVQWRDRSFVLRAPEQVGELGRRLRQKDLAHIAVSISGAVVEGKAGSVKVLSDEEREAVCAVLTDAESDPALRRAFNLLCAEHVILGSDLDKPAENDPLG